MSTGMIEAGGPALVEDDRPSRLGTRAVVIGSGFGGLAAAIRLQARGYRTTILEMRDKPGGRAYVFEDDGFVFDAGPTIITVPFIFEELAEAAGKRLGDYVSIVPCDPYYRIYFDDGSTFDYVGDPERFEGEIRKFNPGDVEGYRRFLSYTERVFDRAFTDLAAHSFHNVWEMLKVAPDLLRLRADQSVYRRVSKFIRDPRLRVALSFEPLLIGGNPLRASSIYAMIHYLEKTWGVHFAMGGTGGVGPRAGPDVRGHRRPDRAQCARLGDRGRRGGRPWGPLGRRTADRGRRGRLQRRRGQHLPQADRPRAPPHMDRRSTGAHQDGDEPRRRLLRHRPDV